MKKLTFTMLLFCAFPASAAPWLQYTGKYVEVRFEGSKRIVNDRHIEVTVDAAPRKPWSASIQVFDATHHVLQTYPVASAYVTNRTAVYLGQGTPPLVLVVEGTSQSVGAQPVDIPLVGHIIQDGVAGPLTVQGTWHTPALSKQR